MGAADGGSQFAALALKLDVDKHCMSIQSSRDRFGLALCQHVRTIARMISTTEAVILGLLAQVARGTYGSELVHMSDGRLKRGSVYSLLGRLEKAGLVESKEEAASNTYALPRTLYKITGAGVAAHAEFAAYVGLELPRGVIGGAT
jgi:DNA-binding PadR family transcriptional regulator